MSSQTTPPRSTTTSPTRPGGEASPGRNRDRVEVCCRDTGQTRSAGERAVVLAHQGRLHRRLPQGDPCRSHRRAASRFRSQVGMTNGCPGRWATGTRSRSDHLGGGRWGSPQVPRACLAARRSSRSTRWTSSRRRNRLCWTLEDPMDGTPPGPPVGPAGCPSPARAWWQTWIRRFPRLSGAFDFPPRAHRGVVGTLLSRQQDGRRHLHSVFLQRMLCSADEPVSTSCRSPFALAAAPGGNPNAYTAGPNPDLRGGRPAPDRR